MTEKDSPRLDINNGFPRGNFVAVDHPEDETSKPHKIDKDIKTTVNQTDNLGKFH